jgi:hypothetical protein
LNPGGSLSDYAASFGTEAAYINSNGAIIPNLPFVAADGQFFLETLHEGSVRRGALAGKYQARMVLSDDDIETRRLAAAALPKKAFQFDSSGLAFEVPAASPIQLRISK